MPLQDIVDGWSIPSPYLPEMPWGMASQTLWSTPEKRRGCHVSRGTRGGIRQRVGGQKGRGQRVGPTGLLEIGRLKELRFGIWGTPMLANFLRTDDFSVFNLSQNHYFRESTLWQV